MADGIGVPFKSAFGKGQVEEGGIVFGIGGSQLGKNLLGLSEIAMIERLQTGGLEVSGWCYPEKKSGQN